MSFFDKLKNILPDNKGYGFLTELIIKAAEKIYDKINKTNEDVGNSKELEDNSSITLIERLNELLYSYVDNYKEIAKNYEVEILNKVNSYFKELIILLKESPEINNEIILILEQKQDNIVKKIPYKIMDVVEKRISLDDIECRKILMLPASENKRKMMKNYCDKVLDEANEKLAENVSLVLNEQKDMLSSFFEDIMEKKERSLKNIHQFLIDLEVKKKQQDFDIEKVQVLPKLKIELVEQACYKLGE